MTSCSSGFKRDVEELGRGFTMLKTFRNNAQSQRLDLSDSLAAVFPVTHNATQRRHFRNPAIIVFWFEFYGKSHELNVAS